jgi:hypothetical protein
VKYKPCGEAGVDPETDPNLPKLAHAPQTFPIGL